MADQLTTATSVTYTPPKAAANSGQSTLGTSGVYNAAAVGSIDIPNGTIVGTVFSIPFNSVDNAKTVIIRNDMTSDVGVRLNGAVADNFELAPSGEMIISNPVAPGTTPITQIDVVTTADPTNLERLFYFVFGD